MATLGVLALISTMILGIAPAGAKSTSTPLSMKSPMDGQTVLNYGGPWDNSCVHQSVSEGWAATAKIIQPNGHVNPDVNVSPLNLPAGTYEIFVGWQPAYPVTWDYLSSFSYDPLLPTSFSYSIPAGTLPVGSHDIAIYVNGPREAGCYTVLTNSQPLTLTITD